MPWMLGNILRNLFSRPATRRYPFKDIREPFSGTRGHIVFDVEKCTLCGACSRICPVNAIAVDKEKGELRYDPFKCIYCGNCVQTCPRQGVSQDGHFAPPAYGKTEEVYKIEKKAEEAKED